MNEGAVPIEFRGFVESALRHKLIAPEWLTVDRLAELLAAKKKVSISATGSDGQLVLPFEVNVSANIDASAAPRLVWEACAASIKFGGSKGKPKAKVPVCIFDTAHGWAHLHPFDREIGQAAGTRHQPHELVPLGWYSPGSLHDFAVSVLSLYFQKGGQHAGRTEHLDFGGFRSQAADVRLVVRGVPSRAER